MYALAEIKGRGKTSAGCVQRERLARPPPAPPPHPPAQDKPTVRAQFTTTFRGGREGKLERLRRLPLGARAPLRAFPRPVCVCVCVWYFPGTRGKPGPGPPGARAAGSARAGLAARRGGRPLLPQPRKRCATARGLRTRGSPQATGPRPGPALLSPRRAPTAPTAAGLQSRAGADAHPAPPPAGTAQRGGETRGEGGRGRARRDALTMLPAAVRLASSPPPAPCPPLPPPHLRANSRNPARGADVTAATGGAGWGCGLPCPPAFPRGLIPLRRGAAGA